MESLEFESRTMLNKVEYDKTVSYFLNNESFTPFITSLTNEYFDNDNLDLLNSKIVLRVRSSIAEGIILTAKIPLVNFSGDKEISQILSIDEYNSFKKGVFPDGPVKKILEDNNKLFPNIKYQTYLKCKRIEIKDGSYLIAIDKNDYLNNHDYNIEVEADSLENANKKILDLSKQINFEVKDFYIPKSRRVLLKKFNLL